MSCNLLCSFLGADMIVDVSKLSEQFCCGHRKQHTDKHLSRRDLTKFVNSGQYLQENISQRQFCNAGTWSTELQNDDYTYR